MELNSCGTRTDLLIDFFPVENWTLRVVVTPILNNAVIDKNSIK